MTLVGGGDDDNDPCSSTIRHNQDEPAFDFCCHFAAPEAGLLRIEVLDTNQFARDVQIGVCKLQPRPIPLHWCDLVRSQEGDLDKGKIEVSIVLDQAVKKIQPLSSVVDSMMEVDFSFLNFSNDFIAMLLLYGSICILGVGIIALIYFIGLKVIRMHNHNHITSRNRRGSTRLSEEFDEGRTQGQRALPPMSSFETSTTDEFVRRLNF